jgi:quercetin dioxygenase-like cupin family protein
MVSKGMPSRWIFAGLAGAGLLIGAAVAKTAYPSGDVLLSTADTVIGQPIIYPAGPAKVTSSIVTLEPGQATGWHRHDAPLVGYILDGEITVDYGPDGTRVYRAGDAFVEALGSAHNGINTGPDTVRMLAVSIGAEGVANTVALPN